MLHKHHPNRTWRKLIPLLLVLMTAAPAFATQNPAKADLTAATSDDNDRYEQLRQSIKKLATEVEALAKRLSDLEKERMFDVTRVLLVGEEQRAESLQARVRDNSEKQSILQMRMDLVDNQLKPENIERQFIGVGLVRPEEAREGMRRRLTIEKQGLLAQLEMLRQERSRFQSALASSDFAIQRLRVRLATFGRP